MRYSDIFLHQTCWQLSQKDKIRLSLWFLHRVADRYTYYYLDNFAISFSRYLFCDLFLFFNIFNFLNCVIFILCFILYRWFIKIILSLKLFLEISRFNDLRILKILKIQRSKHQEIQRFKNSEIKESKIQGLQIQNLKIQRFPSVYHQVFHNWITDLEKKNFVKGIRE